MLNTKKFRNNFLLANTYNNAPYKWHNLYIKTIVIILFVFSSAILKSQTDVIHFKGFGLSDGLTNSHISCIIQDSKGFIWIGTKNGLNRFDGYKFISYFHDPEKISGLPDNNIFDLYLDNKQQLWVATFKGLCKYEPETDNFSHFPILSNELALKFSPVKAISQAKSGEFWLATSSAGLVKFDPVKNIWTLYRHDPKDSKSIASNYLLDIVIDSKSNIWVGNQYDGVSILNHETNTFTHFTAENGKLLNNNILSLYETPGGDIWIGTNGGATVWNELNGGLKHFTNIPNNPLSLSSNIVYDILTDKSGTTWLGTEGGGLNKYNPTNNTFEAYTSTSEKVKGLINDKIRVLYEDNSGNLWLGIHQGGINFKSSRPTVFKHVNHISGNANSLSNNSVLAICAQTENLIWIGTDGGGLNLWNLKQKQIKHFIKTNNKGSIPGNVIRSIFKDHNNDIWIGSYLGGLSKFEPKTNTFKTYQNVPNDSLSLSNNDVTAITEDRLGNLWVGTNGGGLNLLNRETETFTRFYASANNSLTNNWILSLYPDKKGFIWIGTYWGISRLDPLNLEFKTISGNDSTPDENTYYALTEDSKGRFWAGTSNCLKIIIPDFGNQSIITIKEGLPNNTINGILEDKQGNLWISTDNGLACYNYEKNTIKNYYAADGLQSNEFIQGAYAKSPDGSLYFGGINGITRFFPDSLQYNSTAPIVYITDFMIFNHSVSVNEKIKSRIILKKSILETDYIQLNHNDNSFSFEFTAIDYSLPDKIKYACRMKGLNDNWSYYEHNRRIITYTNLDAGTYYFEVKAANNDGVWGNVTRIKLVIHPPYWRTWWALTIYAIFITFILIFLLRTYRLRLYEKNQIKVELLTRQKDQEINEAKLRFFTNISHEFRTPLTLIIGPLDAMLEDKQFSSEIKKQFALMHRNANRLLRLINQLMDLRKIDAGKMELNAEETDMVVFIRDIYDSFVQLADKMNIKFTFNTSFDKKLMWFDTEKMDKILFNLLSNAFKFTQHGGVITIDLRPHIVPEYLALKIEDNGKGIAQQNLNKIYERFYQAETESQLQKGSGIGLWLTKSYVELHKGVIQVDSIEGKGASFIILLPEGKNHLKPNQISKGNREHLHLQPAVFDDSGAFFDPNEIINPEIEKQTILLIEDNDDIRNYIKNGLAYKYEIIEAINGKTGLKMATEFLPDLIITDIMMPEMDGISLCKKIKTDIQTCHIPVIMLTAKTSIEHRIEGLDTGADSYIPKPFNPTHLAVRVKKLLELRKMLKAKFSNEMNFNPEEIAIAGADQKLLQKIIALIKENISEPELNIDLICNEIGISRRHLQRKIKSLTGQSPNEFIRILRLQQAASILANNNLSVAEVAYMVGFSSSSYFSTCFTKQYNISPLQYKENNTKE